MPKRAEKKLFYATISVKLKEGVLDPQGSTIKRALEDMGYKGIEEVRSGKVFEISLNSRDRKGTEKILDEICRKLLANPVIEKYQIEIKR
jgi:phosphoribosylformylglycinamidine synthase PurS subunit